MASSSLHRSGNATSIDTGEYLNAIPKTDVQKVFKKKFSKGRKVPSKEFQTATDAWWNPSLVACLTPNRVIEFSTGPPKFLHGYQEALARWEEGYPYRELPCGKCLPCLSLRKRNWAIRCVHESLTRTKTAFGQPVVNASFLTLTYRDEKRPWNLELRDFQLFMKRLRKRLPGQKLKYLACGEYGEESGNAHFHLILFGEDFTADRYPFRVRGDRTDYRSPLLEEIWTDGFSTIGPMTYATAAYTAGYVMKKMSRRDAVEAGVAWQYTDGSRRLVTEYSRTPEFITMSKKDGLGHDWIKAHWHEVYEQDQVVIDGKTFAPPLYYDKWLKENHPVVYDDVLARRDEKRERKPPTTPLELKARESIWKSQESMKARRETR